MFETVCAGVLRYFCSGNREEPLERTDNLTCHNTQVWLTTSRCASKHTNASSLVLCILHTGVNIVKDVFLINVCCGKRLSAVLQISEDGSGSCYCLIALGSLVGAREEPDDTAFHPNS